MFSSHIYNRCPRKPSNVLCSEGHVKVPENSSPMRNWEHARKMYNVRTEETGFPNL